MSRRRKFDTDSDEESISHSGGKKGLAMLLVVIIALAGIGAASTYWIMSQPSGGYIESGYTDSGTSGQSSDGGNEASDEGSEPIPVETTITADLSVRYAPLSSVQKKVMGELFVTTTCPYCAKTEMDLASLERNRDDFYFVSFVADKNQDAYRRYLEISQNQGTPDTEFDGGYKSELGAVDINNFINDIEACKNNPGTPTEITGSIVSKTENNARISVDIIIGNENFQGSVKAFVIDKNSPWLNVNGDSIPNAFVGYLINEDISSSSVSPDRSREWSVNGYKAFSELAVVIAVYDSAGHAVQAYRMDL